MSVEYECPNENEWCEEDCPCHDCMVEAAEAHLDDEADREREERTLFPEEQR